MTTGVIQQDVKGDVFACVRTRIALAPRPSLGSSQALLLLLSCP